MLLLMPRLIKDEFTSLKVSSSGSGSSECRKRAAVSDAVHLARETTARSIGSRLTAYPSIIQARDGTLHVSYSYDLNRRDLPRDNDGDPAAKSIKHVHFNQACVMAGK